MRFDGNLAWQQAVRLFSANKELLLVLAGVFFFLPGVASALFLSGTQAQLMHDMGTVDSHDSKAMMASVMTMYARIGPSMAALMLVQAAGTMAMMALLTDSARPTVGQAIAQAIRALPTVLGAFVLVALGYLVGAGVFAIALGLIAAAVGALGGGAGGVSTMVLVAVGMGGFFALLVVAMTRLSVTLPVIMIDQVRHPLHALQRSWRLTRGNTASLLGFYVVLVIAYVVIAMLVFMVLTALVALGTDKGSTIYYTISGIISGVIGGVVSALATTILCAVHGQLNGPGREAISETFR